MTTKELIEVIRGGKEHFMPCYRLDELTCNEIMIKLEILQKFEDRFNLIYDSETDSLIEDLIVYKKALDMACDRLGWLEHDCKGCILEGCANYIDDKKCSELIEEACLQKAKECSELMKEACLQKARLTNE